MMQMGGKPPLLQNLMIPTLGMNSQKNAVLLENSKKEGIHGNSVTCIAGSKKLGELNNEFKVNPLISV